jgi:HD-like signal output (HDOD) protein
LSLPVEDLQALDALLGRGIRIPPQPRLLIELREMLGSANYTVKSVSRIINQDPGLVAMLFRVSRSPVFSRGRKFNKLDEVLQIIGIQQTYNLVQSIALSTAISDGTQNAFARFWTRSGEVAELASLIAADHVAVCNVFPDQAYMAGIFHQCGVPLLMMRFPDYCRKLHLDDPNCWPNLAEEDANFNVDHCSIGYLVARHWGLPDFVCAAIRYHDEVPTEEAGAAISLVSIVQLAIHGHLCNNRQANPAWKSIGVRVLEEIGLTSHELGDYLDDLFRRFHGAAL